MLNKLLLTKFVEPIIVEQNFVEKIFVEQIFVEQVFTNKVIRPKSRASVLSEKVRLDRPTKIEMPFTLSDG